MILLDEYKKYLGRFVRTEIDTSKSEQSPNVHIHIFERKVKGKSFFTLATEGMSYTPMVGDWEFSRAELLLYVHEVRDVHIHNLRFLALFPHMDSVCLQTFETVAHHEKLSDQSELQDFFLMPPVISSDSELECVKIEGAPLNIYMVMPITRPERLYKIENGIDAFLDKLDENDVPFIVDEERKSFV